MTRLRWLVTVAVLASIASGCAIVPKNRREHLADPTMKPDEDVMRDRAHARIHDTREGAAGGDGEPAGGGCGCGN
jgi:hypothetical protein